MPHKMLAPNIPCWRDFVMVFVWLNFGLLCDMSYLDARHLRKSRLPLWFVLLCFVSLVLLFQETIKEFVFNENRRFFLIEEKNRRFFKMFQVFFLLDFVKKICLFSMFFSFVHFDDIQFQFFHVEKKLSLLFSWRFFTEFFLAFNSSCHWVF